MKKIFKGLVLGSTLFGALMVTTACNNEEVKASEIKECSYVDILSHQVVAGVNLISEDSTISLNTYTTTSTIPENEEASTEEVEDALGEVDSEDEVEVIDDAIESGEIVTSELDIEVMESDLEGYDFMLVINYEGNTYYAYLNKLRGKIKHHHRKHSFVYEGIIKFEEALYDFEASEEVTSDGEVEASEIEFKLIINKNEVLVISLENEIELTDEQQAYIFNLFKDNELIKSYEIKKGHHKDDDKVRCEFNGEEFEMNFDHENKKVRIKTEEFEGEFDFDSKKDDKEAFKDFIDKMHHHNHDSNENEDSKEEESSENEEEPVSA